MPEEWVTIRATLSVTKITREEASLSSKIILLHLKKIAVAFDNEKRDRLLCSDRLQKTAEKDDERKKFADAILIIF